MHKGAGQWDRGDRGAVWAPGVALIAALVALIVLTGCEGGLWMPFGDEVAVGTFTHLGHPAPVVDRDPPRVAPAGNVVFIVQPPMMTVAEGVGGPSWEVPAPGTRTVVWVPPLGASAFTFSVAPDPGGPPYVFSDVSADTALILSYRAPSSEGQMADTFLQAYEPMGVGSVQLGGVTKLTTVEAAVGRLEARTASDAEGDSGLGQAQAIMAPASADDDNGLRIVQTLSPVDQTLDTALCEDLRSALASGRLLVGVRVPLQADATDDTNLRLPLLLNGGYAQTLALETDAAPATPAMTATLSYAPDAWRALSRQMPAGDDEFWLALAGESISAPCATGLSAPAGAWDLALTLQMDIEPLATDVARRGVLLTYCWEGLTSPFGGDFAGMRAKPLSTDAGQALTCLLPVPLDANAEAGLALNNLQSGFASATRVLSVTEVLRNETTAPAIVSVARASTLPAPWAMYISTPDSVTPTTGPLSESATFQVGPGVLGAVKLWFFNTVGASVEAGAYTLAFTATDEVDPQLTAWDAVPLWVGAWVPTVFEEKVVFLPLVMRGF
ncbi:MAG: hypothetical protein JXC32_13530 [Anaerolineae bacterium]|nr:hypothetical protein [Anaerolineae bacterium]